MIGKSSPHNLPVAGLIEAGPVEPMQPPITFEQMTKYFSVSSGRPGPTMVSHQPGLPSDRVHIGDVLIARQRVANQNGVWNAQR